MLYVILVLIGCIMIGPFFWMVSTSLKQDSEIFTLPVTWLPKVPQFGNYVEALQAGNFPRYFLNSAVVTISVLIIQLLFCSMAAYSFARLNFPYRDLLFLAVLITLMIPYQATIVPVFVLLKKFPLCGGNNFLGQGGKGLVDSYPGLILPQAVNVFGVFLLRQFFKTLPSDLEDAARIDGCSEPGIYWKIILPLSKPALATLAIFSFITTWNAFIWPLIITTSEEMATVQLGLTMFQTQYTTEWRLLMCVSSLAILPVLALFAVGQKYYVRGIALSGIRG